MGIISSLEATPQLTKLITPTHEMSTNTASNDILSWTNQDPRESVLFNSWGVLYRFQVNYSICSYSSTLNGQYLDNSQSHWPKHYYALEVNKDQPRGPSGQTRVGSQWWTRACSDWEGLLSSLIHMTFSVQFIQ